VAEVMLGAPVTFLDWLLHDHLSDGDRNVVANDGGLLDTKGL
jgi:hypothetical protein